MSKRIELAGKRFGAWTVLEYVGVNENAHPSWRCRCDCGTVRTVVGQTLRNGLTTSCGCLKGVKIAKARTVHGHSAQGVETRTYRIWKAMHNRCRPANTNSHMYYADRGISVCSRWSDYGSFLADMGPVPDGLSIDRIDNDGNYEPGNCHWATPTQQNVNKRAPSVPRKRNARGRFA